MLSGYSKQDLKDTCSFGDDAIPRDACPYIWKRFSSGNYVTAMVEDAPRLGFLNFMKLGFGKCDKTLILCLMLN